MSYFGSNGFGNTGRCDCWESVFSGMVRSEASEERDAELCGADQSFQLLACEVKCSWASM